MNSNATNGVCESVTLVSDANNHYVYNIILKDPLTKSSQQFYFSNNLTNNTSVKIANLKFEEGLFATP